MDKSFNFFKSKTKKQNQRRNHSKSNSSKASYSKQSDKVKNMIKNALSKREKQIREAIQSRYIKSKIRTYKFTRRDDYSQRTINSSHSSELQEFKHLKKLCIVDLKDYHKKQESLNYSIHSSQDKKKFNLKIKLKDNNFIIKTEGNENEIKNNSSKILKNTATSKISKKTQEEWKFISIQFKEDLSKPKNRKTQMKINSHRSYTIQNQKTPKLKINNSMNKNLDKPNKIKQINGSRITKTRF